MHLPLQEREMNVAIQAVEKNRQFHELHTNPNPTHHAKAETQLLVCSGAPGIGNFRCFLTCFGF
jgi:hypothetical protein